MLNLYLTAEIAESAEKNLNLFWKPEDHEKNDGPIFHAGFRVTTNFKSCSLRRLVVVTFEKYNYKTMKNIRDTKAGLADRRRDAEEVKGQVKDYSTQDI